MVRIYAEQDLVESEQMPRYGLGPTGGWGRIRPQSGPPAFGAGQAAAKRRRERRAEHRRHLPSPLTKPTSPFNSKKNGPGLTVVT
jgi:hypothetical protein